MDNLDFRKKLSGIKPSINLDVSDIMSVCSEIKSECVEEVVEIIPEKKSRFSGIKPEYDLSSSFLQQLSAAFNEQKEVKQEEVVLEDSKIEIPIPEIIEEKIPEIVHEPVVEPVKIYSDHFRQPNTPKVEPNIRAIQSELKHLKDWMYKISLAGPGGGEVNLRYLDDVDTDNESANTYLRYDATSRHYIFDKIRIAAKTITSNTYTTEELDYYVGVNYAGQVNITLRDTQNSSIYIIKDESGSCSSNNIIITPQSGLIDGQANVILAINYGSLTFVKNGDWRIV